MLVLAAMAQAQSTPVAKSSIPAIDPAATALLEQSVQAYSRLNSASMSFTASEQTEAKGEITSESLSGTIAFVRPDKARLEFREGKNTSLFLINGTQFIEQTEPRQYREFKVEPSQTSNSPYIESVLRSIPSGLSIFLPLLAADEWKQAPQQFTIQKMVLLPDNGVKLTAKLSDSPLPPITFWLYFDPTDYLLRRVEAKLIFKGLMRHNITILNNIQVNPALSPDTFAFTPEPGAKRANRSTRPPSRLRPR